MGTDDLGNRLSLGLTQLWKFVGHMAHRAVLLTQLLTAGSQGQMANPCFVALIREHLGQHLSGAEIRIGCSHSRVVTLDEGDTLLSKSLDRVVSPGLSQESQRVHRQLVVLLVEAAAP